MNHQVYLVRYGVYFYYISFDLKKHRLVLSSLTNISCINYINISDFKLFDISGFNQLLLKFFSKQSFSLYFTTGYDRAKFYHEVYPDYPKFPSNELKICIIGKLIKSKIGFEHFLFLYTKSRISKLKMYYNHQLYDYMNGGNTIDEIFFYSQDYLIEKVFKLLFNTIYRIIPSQAEVIITKKKATLAKESIKANQRINDYLDDIDIDEIVDSNENKLGLTDYEGNIIKDSIFFKHRSKIGKSKLGISYYYLYRS